MDYSSHDTVITLWFVTATHPEKVIATMPRADRGFGRKLLSQLNPRWPITPIGQFALNRSAQPSRSEFYIAGFPGLSIIQTVVDDLTMISGVDHALRTAIPAENVYAIATNAGTSYGAFAHWSRGNLKRAFAAIDEKVYEDLGLVETFESSYWAGYHTTETSGITLPFSPIDLAIHAQRSWLGFDMDSCPDINIVAYAVDGRPEPKITYRQPIDARPLTERTTTKLSLGSTRSTGEFDDYELPDDFDGLDGTSTKYAEEAVALTKKSVTKTKGLAARFRERLTGFGHGLKERLRHTDRPAATTSRSKKPAAALKSAKDSSQSSGEKPATPASTNASGAKAAATEKKPATAATAATATSAQTPADPKGAKDTEGAHKGANKGAQNLTKETAKTTAAVNTKAIGTTDAIGTDAITAGTEKAPKDGLQSGSQHDQPAAAGKKTTMPDAESEQTSERASDKAQTTTTTTAATTSKAAPAAAANATPAPAPATKKESTGSASATAKREAPAKPATASSKSHTSTTESKTTKTPAKSPAKATKAAKAAKATAKATKKTTKTTTKAVKRTTKATTKASAKTPETAAFPSSPASAAATTTSESEAVSSTASKAASRSKAATTPTKQSEPAGSPETKAFPAETTGGKGTADNKADAAQPAPATQPKKRRTLGGRTTRSKKD